MLFIGLIAFFVELIGFHQLLADAPRKNCAAEDSHGGQHLDPDTVRTVFGHEPDSQASDGTDDDATENQSFEIGCVH